MTKIYEVRLVEDYGEFVTYGWFSSKEAAEELRNRFKGVDETGDYRVIERTLDVISDEVTELLEDLAREKEEQLREES